MGTVLFLGKTVRRFRGFILPLAVILVVILSISGTAFMHHDYLERRMAMNEVDNHGAFFLANAGFERGREALKIPFVSGAPSWTSMLEDPALADPTPNAGCPTSMPNCLCPDLTRGCAVPPFGAAVTAPNLPFGGTFTAGSYIVRSFNDDAPGEVGTTDLNGILTVRALGTIRSELKLLEADLKATSALNLINCQGAPGTPCPDNVNGNPGLDPFPGREPDSHPTPPFLNPPLSDPSGYYRDPSNFPGLTPKTFISNITLVPSKANKPGEVQIEHNTYYFTTGTVDLDHVSGYHDIVVVALGDVEVGSNVALTDTTIVSGGQVSLNGGVEIRSALPLPAVIAQQAVHGDANVVIFGAVLSGGAVDLNPIQVHGVVIGDPVEVQGGAGALYTDDGNLDYYDLIPGVFYSEDLKTTITLAGSWRELQ